LLLSCEFVSRSAARAVALNLPLGPRRTLSKVEQEAFEKKGMHPGTRLSQPKPKCIPQVIPQSLGIDYQRAADPAAPGGLKRTEHNGVAGLGRHFRISIDRTPSWSPNGEGRSSKAHSGLRGKARLGHAEARRPTTSRIPQIPHGTTILSAYCFSCKGGSTPSEHAVCPRNPPGAQASGPQAKALKKKGTDGQAVTQQEKLGMKDNWPSFGESAR
jgi:hypothetical protein